MASSEATARQALATAGAAAPAEGSGEENPPAAGSREIDQSEVPAEPADGGRGVTVAEAEAAAAALAAGGRRPGRQELEEAALVEQLKRRTPPQQQRHGAQVAHFLFLFGGLLDRPFGSAQSIAAAGNVVVARCQVEAEAMAAAEDGPADRQLAFELLRVLRLLAADVQLIAAARRQETLLQRLDSAKANCKLAIQLANSL